MLSIRYPLAVELGVGLSGGGPWVLLELGFFFLSEDLMLSILYPLAVEQVGMSTMSAGGRLGVGRRKLDGDRGTRATWSVHDLPLVKMERVEITKSAEEMGK